MPLLMTWEPCVEVILNSIQKVFTQYERLTRKSRLVLKAEKTEILVLNSTRENTYTVTYIDRVPYFH